MFTGVYGFVIGLVWLLLGLILAIILCYRFCSPPERSSEHHSTNYYWIPRIIVLVLSLLTMYVHNLSRPYSVFMNLYPDQILDRQPSVTLCFWILARRAFFVPLFILNQHAYHETTEVKTTFVAAGTLVTNTIHTVTSTLDKVEATIQKYNIPGWQVLNSTEAKLDEQADLVTAKINRDVHKFNNILNDV